MPEQSLEAKYDLEPIHNSLVDSFTDRYIKKMHISALAYGARYDQASTLSDYEQTWWPAKPKDFSEDLARTVMALIFRMTPLHMQKKFLHAFEGKEAKKIEAALHDFPIMTINGHSPDLSVVLPIFGISKALAERKDPDHRTEAMHDMFRLSHVVATRGLTPLSIRPRFRHNDNRTLLRAAQLITNPHFTFPRTQKMMESGIPEDFIGDYNANARQDMLAAVRMGSSHPDGLHQVWAMAPGAGPDIKTEDGKRITQKVGDATIRLVKEMGVGLLPIYSSFVHGQQRMVVARLRKPDEISDMTLHGIMAELASFRRDNGEPNVHYAKELQ